MTDGVDFKELRNMRMPFGRYQGVLLKDIPENYYIWMMDKGFPSGKLGDMMRCMYEIKLNGLEYLL